LCTRCLDASGGNPDPENPNWFLGSSILMGFYTGKHKDHALTQKAQAAVYRGQSENAGRQVVSKPKPLPVVSAPRKPCQHLGEFIRSEECATCTGKVLIKHYACNHPAHEETTIAGCQKCPDHQPK
jgi:hypothetical protein